VLSSDPADYIINSCCTSPIRLPGISHTLPPVTELV